MLIMAIVSIKTLMDRNKLATPRQFDDWNKAWRVALEGGSQETLLSFIAREKGNTEDAFLQELAKALGWPFVELSKTEVSPEARKKISTKVAFQYFVLPITFENGQLQVVVSNPFDALTPRARVKRVASAPKRSMKLPRMTMTWSRWPKTRRSPKTTRRPASSVLSIRLFGRLTRTAPPTFISSRPRMNCASATGLTAFCTRRRCRRN